MGKLTHIWLLFNYVTFHSIHKLLRWICCKGFYIKHVDLIDFIYINIYLIFINYCKIISMWATWWLRSFVAFNSPRISNLGTRNSILWNRFNISLYILNQPMIKDTFWCIRILYNKCKWFCFWRYYTNYIYLRINIYTIWSIFTNKIILIIN